MKKKMILLIFLMAFITLLLGCATKSVPAATNSLSSNQKPLPLTPEQEALEKERKERVAAEQAAQRALEKERRERLAAEQAARRAEAEEARKKEESRIASIIAEGKRAGRFFDIPYMTSRKDVETILSMSGIRRLDGTGTASIGIISVNNCPVYDIMLYGENIRMCVLYDDKDQLWGWALLYDALDDRNTKTSTTVGNKFKELITAKYGKPTNLWGDIWKIGNNQIQVDIKMFKTSIFYFSIAAQKRLEDAVKSSTKSYL